MRISAQLKADQAREGMRGDRVEIGGRERVVTSVVPGRRRGRRTLYVAHVAPGDALAVADVTTVPVPLDTPRENYSPRVIAAHVLTSAAHTLRSAGVIIPETPASARREYVAARERGETVSLALTRARLEIVVNAVLSPMRDFSGWTIDAAELERVTRSPELDALSGTVMDAEGRRVLRPIMVPDGITLTVSTEYDDYSEYVADDDCYSPEDVDAWCGDLWEYRTVTVTATDADGDEFASESLGGVEVGDYWPGTEPAQIWHAIPDLIREALDDLPMTCGTCGHRYADNTPAGRCPREADHVYDDDDLPVVSVTWSDDDRCPVVRVDVQPGAGHVQVQLGDALIYDADPEISPPDADMARRVERARAILGDVSGHYAPRDQRSIDALAALDGRDL